MLQHVISTYQRFAKWSRQSRWSRPVKLNVVALEERATPAATANITPLVAPPQTVQVAPIIAGSLAIPMAGQSMVRLDLIAPGESARAEHADVWTEPEALVARTQPQEPIAAPAESNADDLAATEAELAEWLAAHPNNA